MGTEATYRYISNSDIDSEQWDDCVKRSLQGMVYAESWFLEIVSPGYDAIVKNNYEAILPLCWNKKGLFKRIYPPYFTQQLGIYSEHKISSPECRLFLDAIPKEFKFQQFYFNSFQVLEQWMFPSFSDRRNYILSLDDNYEDLFQNFSGNTRRLIQKVKQKNFKLQKIEDPQELIELFQKNQGKKLRHLSSNYFRLVYKVMIAAENRKQSLLHGIRDENGLLLAGGFFLIGEKRIANMFVAGNEFARDEKLMYLIINGTIKHFASTGLIFDFEGSNVESIASFFRKFGPKEEIYREWQTDSRPKWYRWMENKLKKLK